MMSGYLGEVLVFLLISTRGPAQIPTDADGFAAEKRQARHAAAEAVNGASLLRAPFGPLTETILKLMLR
jgi:hypothetical protein